MKKIVLKKEEEVLNSISSNEKIEKIVFLFVELVTYIQREEGREEKIQIVNFTKEKNLLEVYIQSDTLYVKDNKGCHKINEYLSYNKVEEKEECLTYIKQDIEYIVGRYLYSISF